MDTRTNVFRLRIERVRDALRRQGLAAVLVPSSDPHLSEYLPERWQGREWLSGFTGSMGTLVVTLDAACVFADSRYWVQAEAELAGTGTACFSLSWLIFCGVALKSSSRTSTPRLLSFVSSTSRTCSS